MRSPVVGATPTQVGMLLQLRLVLQHRLVCYPSTSWYSNASWYATPAQVGTPTQANMLLQRRLVCDPSTGWYVTPVRKTSESVELLMIYRFVKINKTMAKLYKHAKADCSRRIPS
jgi:hypothetical protein